MDLAETAAVRVLAVVVVVAAGQVEELTPQHGAAVAVAAAE